MYTMTCSRCGYTLEIVRCRGFRLRIVETT